MPDTDLPTPPADGPGAARWPAMDVAAAFDDRLQHCRRLLNDGLFAEGEAAARSLVDDAVEAARPATAAHAALLLARLMANTSRAGAAIAWSRRCLQLAADADAPHLQSSAWVVLAGASADLQARMPSVVLRVSVQPTHAFYEQLLEGGIDVM